MQKMICLERRKAGMEYLSPTFAKSDFLEQKAGK